MSETPEFCRERAAALRLSYRHSNLFNVRDRYEQAARKWDAMAELGERVQRARKARALPV